MDVDAADEPLLLPLLCFSNVVGGIKRITEYNQWPNTYWGRHHLDTKGIVTTSDISYPYLMPQMFIHSKNPTMQNPSSRYYTVM